VLKLSDNLSLPLDAVTQTFAILAKRGVGKTHTATIMAEGMLNAGQPIVVYDPTSAWWGLKSSKDGKRPGFPVVIFGGEHADVPLEESAGSTIAMVIVEKRIPAILDVGLLRKGARVRFMTEFCETLYHKNREALHFFADEAHTIAPQNIRAMPEAARLLGAMEDIVLQGRRRGLGVTVISQRPALVNKNVTTQCEVLIAMQLTGAHDRKAIEEWVDAHGDDASKGREMLSSLSSLQRGEAWIWSPGWLRKLVRTTFRDRETFDSSATPKVGGRLVSPKTVAAVDLNALGEQIKATVEKAKADDPKELRKQIAELQKQLNAKPAPAVDQAAIDRAIGSALQTRDRQWEAVTAEERKAFDLAVVGLKDRLERIGQLANLNGEVVPSIARPAPIIGKPAQNIVKQPVPSAHKPAHNPPRKPEKPIASADQSGLGKAAIRVLHALYWLRQESSTTPPQVAFHAGYTVNGHFNNLLGQLRALGLLNGWRITPEGEELAIKSGVTDRPTGGELQGWMRQKLSGPEQRIFDVLIGVSGDRVPVEQLAELSGYTVNGHFKNSLGHLRSIGIAEGGAREGGVKASDVFFD
jgi:hypothetical protein